MMVWNTIFVWLVAVGIVGGFTGLALLSGEKLLVILVPLYLGMFVAPIAAAITGLRAGSGNGDFVTGLVISSIICCVCLYVSSDQGRHFDLSNFAVSILTLAVFLIAFGIGKAQLYLKTTDNSLAYAGATFAGIVLFLIGVYLLAAFQSTTAYSFLPKELFLTRPANDITSVNVGNGESVLRNQDGTLFTGLITSYKERLSLNFFTKTVSGIAYYLDGQEFGHSGDIELPGHYNKMYGSYAGTTNCDSENIQAQQPVMIHKDYLTILRRELPLDKLVSFRKLDETENRDRADYIAVFAYDDRLERKTISLHMNGVVYYIYTYPCTGNDGWAARWSAVGFDMLGYRNDVDTDIKWSESDFIATEFGTLDIIKDLPANVKPLPEVPDKIIYVPSPEKWEHSNTFDNIVAVHDMPLGIVNAAILGNDRQWKWLSIEDGNNFLEIMGRSTVRINVLDDEDGIEKFQRESALFLVRDKEQTKEIGFYYQDGKLLINNGPYYMHLAEDKPDDSAEDIAKRKELFEKFLLLIKNYKGAEIQEEEIEITE